MPSLSWVTDVSTVLDVTAVLVAAAIALSGAELLAIRSEYRAHGLFDPRVVSSTRTSVVSRGLVILTMPRLAVAQLALALIVVLFLAVGLTPTVPLVLLAVALVLQAYLLPFGRDGADDMTRIVTIATAIAFLFEARGSVVKIALAFIAAQLCLAYGASGVAKLFGPTWRAGAALQGILHTAFSHEGRARSAIERWPGTGKALTRLAAGLEIAFPVGIVLGGWAAVASLAAAAAFHVIIALTMGLSRFTPSFLAAFPATAWAASQYGLFS